MENIITARGVTRCFPVGNHEDFYALKDVDIDIRKGALTILKGRSGSGKTTLLNILSTLDIPTEGEVYMEDISYRTLSEHEREELRKNRIGFVFQSVALIPVMNAYENVDFALRLAEPRKKRSDTEAFDVRERIEYALSLVGIQERALHMPGQMSGGEQQRVAIARAIVHKPSIVFADEPTGALDTENGLKCMHLFRRLTEQENITIVMTTHDPNLMEMGDVVYEVEDGRIVDRKENSRN